MFYKYVLCYLRLSRDDEDRMDESNSIKNQRLLLRHFIEKKEEFRESQVIYFVDDGFSGTSFNRPDFIRMMEFVRKGESCCIIVKDLSRFGRDTIDSQNYLEKVFPFLHVRFIAINDFYDSDAVNTSGKDLEVKFKNLINGIYPQICSKNIKQVLRKQSELGKYHGAVPPFGYRFPQNTRTELLVDEEAAATVRMIFKWFLEGKSPTEIAYGLNEQQVVTPTRYLREKGYQRNLKVASIWTREMVRGILKNPVYTGTMVNHKTENRIVSVKSAVTIPREEWICVSGTHEEIISTKDFDEVVGKFEEKKSVKKERTEVSGSRHHSVLHGKIRCGHCKRKVRIRDDGRYKTVKFSCSSLRLSTSLGCYPEKFEIAIVEKLVLELIKKQAAFAEDAIKAGKQMSETLDSAKLRRKQKAVEGKLASCRTQKMGLYEKYAAGELSREEYFCEKGKTAQKENEYKKQAEEIKQSLMEISVQKEQSSELQKVAKYAELEALSKEIVEELVEVIYFYDPEHMEVVWKFRDDFLAGSGTDMAK